jgi:diguanylate cyclase (GGDEF)-like protein
MSPPGRPKGECRSAKHGGCQGRRGAASAMLLALVFTLAVPAVAGNAAGHGGFEPGSFEDRVDLLVRDGFERPTESLLALEKLRLGSAASPAGTRLLLQAAGSVAAESGRAVQAATLAEQLLSRSPEEPGGGFVASSNLVRALVAQTAGQLDVAAALAQSALPVLQTGCPGTSVTPPVISAVPDALAAAPASPASAVPLPPGTPCDYRSAWRALRVLEHRALSLGLTVTATAHAQAGLALAEWAGDPYRQVVNLGTLAVAAQHRGEGDLARQWVAQARRLPARNGDLNLQAYLANVEAQLASGPADAKAALRGMEEARTLARRANAPRLEAMMLSNLADMYARLGRPADALRAAELAMPVVRAHGDLRAERVLINNAGIAKIGLGRIAEGKLDLTRALELWQRSGEPAGQAATLLEFGEALGAAGDARGALELYHRERSLSTELMRANRTVALRELRSRNDAESNQRNIDLLARDNALKTEALANRDLTQRIWWLLAAVMALSIAIIALLYLRVRETHKKLAANHDQLRVQSERDPLTNLANRRHFQDVMALQAGGPDDGFEGALLLVDIDHFKHVNDTHGHSAGDQVLVEVAKRLNDAVRREDLIVRWGGEEFLIMAPRAAPEQADQIAMRVLRSLGQAPIVVGGVPLRVTASIGYARFPLPPHNTGVPWEQVINLADMALYTAKNQGRNRAFGITSTTAATRAALRDVEADFDRAWHEGRVTLLQSLGPEPMGVLRAA